MTSLTHLSWRSLTCVLAITAAGIGLDATANAEAPALSTSAPNGPGHLTAWTASVHAVLERRARDAVAAARAAFTQSGVASWYGYESAGRRTSSGIRFNPMLLTCAHRTQPLGSRLLVTSEATGRSVVVTVTDRGPYAGPDRIIDLSRAAASRIGMVQGGLNHVTIERVNPAGAPADNDVEVAQAPDGDDNAQAVKAAAKP